jgi:DNA-binding CsgD family transcriptional regulator
MESSDQVLRAQLDRVARGLEPIAPVREQILDSWRQSFALGLHPAQLAAPFDGSVDLQSELVQDALPVIGGLVADLSGANMTVLLSDADVRIVSRHAPSELSCRRLDALSIAPGRHWAIESVGTTSLGLTAAGQSSALVVGAEHFMDDLIDIASASAIVCEPRTGRALGAVTLLCAQNLVSPLMLPVVRRAAREIEARLIDEHSSRLRLLNAHFFHARRRVRSPLAVVGERTLLMNAAASLLLCDDDHQPLWHLAVKAISDGASALPAYSTSTGTSMNASVEVIREGTAPIGALLRIRPAADELASRSPAQSHGGSDRTQHGWESLTPPERHLAELVSDGLTNKEAAAQMFLSHHTIDSHLRHIFRKLEINSRVTLAGLVAAALEHERAAA